MFTEFPFNPTFVILTDVTTVCQNYPATTCHLIYHSLSMNEGRGWRDGKAEPRVKNNWPHSNLLWFQSYSLYFLPYPIVLRVRT